MAGMLPVIRLSLNCPVWPGLEVRQAGTRWKESAVGWKFFPGVTLKCEGFPGSSVVKNLPANSGDARDVGLIPGSRGSPGGGHGNLFQFSCLENSMDKRSLVGYSLGSQRVGHDWVTNTSLNWLMEAPYTWFSEIETSDIANFPNSLKIFAPVTLSCALPIIVFGNCIIHI